MYGVKTQAINNQKLSKNSKKKMEQYLASKEPKGQDYAYINENSQSSALSPVHQGNDVSFGTAASHVVKSFSGIKER